jgi:hypothetical protein
MALVLLRVVWTEEVMLEVKLEKKKVLPEDGAELLGLLDLLLLLLLLLVGEVLVATALLPFISLSLPPPRAELANEPIPPIMADHGLLKLLDVLALVLGAAEGAFNSVADVDDDAAAALVAAALPSLLVTSS